MENMDPMVERSQSLSLGQEIRRISNLGGEPILRLELLPWSDEFSHTPISKSKDKTIYTIHSISSDGLESPLGVISIQCSPSIFCFQEHPRVWTFYLPSTATITDTGKMMEKSGIFPAIKRRISYIMAKIASALRTVQPFYNDLSTTSECRTSGSMSIDR